MKVEEKTIYFIVLIALCFIIIFDSSFELSKKAAEEELKIVRPIAITNLVVAIIFLLLGVGVYIFNN
jgi:predicted Na+-dependent transporter